MKHRKKVYLFLIALAAVASILGAMIAQARTAALKVAFLDVGQGDAILIEQGERQILIDGGPSGQKLLAGLGKYVPFWDRKIDVVIATHPDADHISGLVDALKNYEVGAFIRTGAESQSGVYDALVSELAEKGIDDERAMRGMEIRLSDEAVLSILAPLDEADWQDAKDTNGGSVVARLSFGQNRFLLTGDFPGEKEPALIASGQDLSADVLKVSHHGSKSATTEEFLKAVKPEKAVISVGQGNRYGHPAAETLGRLNAAGTEVFRTDESGDVVFDCPDIGSGCLASSGGF